MRTVGKMQVSNWVRVGLCCLLVVPVQTLADIGESLVVIDAYRGSRLQHELSGFVVAQDVVVTNANLLSRADRIVIRDPELGTEIDAEVLHRDEVSGIAILETLGLPAIEAELSTGKIPEPSTVSVPRSDGNQVVLREGHIAREFQHSDDDDPVRVFGHYEHTVQISRNEFGMPLLNECGQIAGMVRPRPGLSRFELNRDEATEGLMVATDIAALQAALVQLGIEIKQADAPCKGKFNDALDRAEQKEKEAEDARKSADTAKAEAEAARKKAEEARSKAEELAKQTDASEAEKKAAEQAAEEARRAAEEAAELAKQREEEAAELLKISQDAQAQVETLEQEQEYLYLALIGGGALLVLVVLVWMIMSRRRRRQLQQTRNQAEKAEEALAQAFKPASFGCLLEGETADGKPVAVKISAEDLGAKEGAVVGRNPRESVAILDHEQASREHFKLLASGSELFIEDLNSANGTQVNGRDLTAGQMVALKEGDEIGVGSALVLNVKII